MEKIQVTLLVEESKELIARAVVRHKAVQESLKNGKLVFKGGTTVSRISEKLVGVPLRICGRITERGAASSLKSNGHPHTLLLEGGIIKNIDDCMGSEYEKLSCHDTVIIGANAIDVFGNAAMMAGSPGGGDVGRNMSFLSTEGVRVLVPVGLEKLIPGNLNEAVSRSSRKGLSLSYGMSVGLFPVHGEIITEVEAIKLLADVECHVIGAGGLGNAKGSVTLEIWGHDWSVAAIHEIIRDIKSSELRASGEAVSLIECAAPCSSCGRHLACGYKSGQLQERNKTRLGIITIGQSPRLDLTEDIQQILGDDVIFVEKGVLDDYSYDEAAKRFAPEKDETALVSRLRDGRQVTLSEEKILSGIQDCISEIEEACDIVLLLCTGRFPAFIHNKPLIVPQGIIHSTLDKLETGKKIGVIIPDHGQIDSVREWWAAAGLELEVEVASPYGDKEEVKAVASRFMEKDISYIVLDCMGYTSEMKKMVSKESGKFVMLPRTMIARLIGEIVER